MKHNFFKSLKNNTDIATNKGELFNTGNPPVFNAHMLK